MLTKAFAHLWTAAADLLTDERQRSVRTAVWVFGFVVVGILMLTGAIAGRIVLPEHPLWDVILQARLVLVRLVLAPPIAVIGIACAVAFYQVIENSDLGVRLMVALGSDDAHSEAQKVGNGGRLLATLVGACVIGFLFGCLR